MTDSIFTLIDGKKDSHADPDAPVHGLAPLPVTHTHFDGVTITYQPGGATLSVVDYDYLKSREFGSLLPTQAIALMGLLQVEHMHTRSEAVEAFRDALIKIEEFSPRRRRMLKWLAEQQDERVRVKSIQDWMTAWWQYLKG